MNEYTDTRPLNDAELNHLLLIYRKRLKNFSPPIVVMLSIILFFSIYFADVIYTAEDYLTIGMHATKYFFIAGSPAFLFGWLIYFTRIYAYKADAEGGIKEMIPYEIQEKEYFYRTNKFYFRIDAPGNLHYEVDEETYLRYREGDVIYVSRAPRSKYTFEYGGRFSLV